MANSGSAPESVATLMILPWMSRQIELLNFVHDVGQAGGLCGKEDRGSRTRCRTSLTLPRATRSSEVAMRSLFHVNRGQDRYLVPDGNRDFVAEWVDARSETGWGCDDR